RANCLHGRRLRPATPLERGHSRSFVCPVIPYSRKWSYTNRELQCIRHFSAVRLLGGRAQSKRPLPRRSCSSHCRSPETGSTCCLLGVLRGLAHLVSME